MNFGMITEFWDLVLCSISFKTSKKWIRKKVAPIRSVLIQIFIILLMAIWKSSVVVNCQTTCSQGYFSQDGSWVLCDDSCLEWDDATSCTSCTDSMFLNTSTGLCELWPDGQYFNPTSRTWLSCDGNCFDRWAYQSFWFDWPAGEFFHLESMECVTECGTDEIALNDEQFWDKPLWRSFKFYINSESTEIIELGTKAYPYKNIGLPFVEILNYHSHSDHNITVLVKEYTENLLLYRSNYIINMTQVTVETYSALDINMPGWANITIKREGVNMITSKSVFNIMKHNTLRLDSILNKDQMTDLELSLGEYIPSMLNVNS